MVEIIRMDPHDPLPGGGHLAVVIRRFGEDDPNAVITEIDFFGAHPTIRIAAGPNGEALAFEDAVHQAAREAKLRGFARVYAVDRTAGRREQEVIGHHGDHAVRSSELSDTDEEEGESGTTIWDRPGSAGYMR
jgi:hypothetical protein